MNPIAMLIKDPHFKVDIDLDGSSPRPDCAIWRGQHACVSEEYAFDAIVPKNPAKAIIDHQLRVKHWSVLEFGFVVLHFNGFPHDTVMQLVRHQDSKPLVQSMRYTGKRIQDVCDMGGDKAFETLEKLFYCKPVGIYAARSGGTYAVTPEQRQQYLYGCWQSCMDYDRVIRLGWPEEDARRELKSGYRQGFTMAGSIRAMFHMLDQRTLSDTQIEARTLAWMALEKLKEWSPELFQWYELNRAGKNQLAP